MNNFKLEKKYPSMELTDDTLEQVSGGTDNYVEIIPNWAVIGNAAVSDDTLEEMMPVGAITEA